MAVIPQLAVALAPVVAITTTFCQLYEPPEADPYAGAYAQVMTCFEVPVVGAWSAANNHAMVM
jgi:hypothetical protein